MTDTQWPRFEVFKQDNPKKRHEAVGSVHAPDAELALLSARNVFVRRPSAVSLWVAPASAIFTLTREEMEAEPNWWVEMLKVAGPERPYLIFTKTSQRRSMTFVQHAGQVDALTAKLALYKAIESNQFESDNVWVWWVVADELLTRSEQDDIDSLFAPAKEKTYRQQNHYGFVSPRRQKRGRSQTKKEPAP